MNTESYLEQARRYEFNAMQSSLSGDEKLSDRYEYLSRMSMIDAARCFDKESNYQSYINTNNYIDFSKHPTLALIAICTGILISTVIYVL